MKLDELTLFLNSNNVDIACITETWLKATIPNSAIHIDGYSVIRRDRTDITGGGVCIYIRQSISHRQWNHLDEEGIESLWLTIRSKKLPREISMISLGVLYMPPGCPERPRNERQYVSHILQSLDTISRAHPDTGIFVVGDFNHMKDKHIKNYPLKQLVKSPTHMASILDCIYTNLEQYYNAPSLSPGVGLSRHAMVMCKPKLVLPNKQIITLRHRTNSHNAKCLFVNDLKNMNWHRLYNMDTSQNMYAQFSNAVHILLDKHLPFISMIKFATDKPWVSAEFKSLISQRQHHFKNGNTVQYNHLRNQVNRKSKSLRSKYYHMRIENLSTCNPREWWKKTKELIGQHTDKSEVYSTLADGNMHKLVNDMNEFFQSVSAHLIPISTHSHLETPIDHIPAEFIISQHDIEVQLMGINIFKAGGPDGIPNWVLRDLAGLLSAPLCAIFNKSISEGKVPREWKRANVAPVPKTNPPHSIESDIRPISLTSTVSKILETFICNQILSQLSHLDHHQYGSIKGLSTTHALVDLLHHIHEIIHSHHSARICFIDYSKAFDLIDHHILVDKFTKLGVHPVLVRWLRDYLDSREQRVKIGNDVSSWLQLNGAIPQGSCLGPLCFIVYISDIDIPANLRTHKYIDDITITECIHPNQMSKMPHAIDLIKSWSDKNHMKLNSKKTKEMLITFQQKPHLTQALHVNNTVIERVNHFKILGIWISDDLTWKHHINHLHTKASPRLYYLKQLRRCGLPIHDLVKYYRAIIRPLFEYASPVWHSSLTITDSETLEQIQRRALKIILPNTSYDSALQITQLQLLSTRRDTISKQFFNKIRHPDCKLNYLLQKRDTSAHDIRNPTEYHCPIPHNERFKRSFIIHQLLNQNRN